MWLSVSVGLISVVSLKKKNVNISTLVNFKLHRLYFLSFIFSACFVM